MASKLDQWLATFSRGTLATMAIGAGILFIVFVDPPHTVCDAQVEHFKKQQGKFLFPTLEKNTPRGASYPEMQRYCELGNTPGACYELFAQLRLMTRDLASIPNECTGIASSLAEVEKALWGGLKFLVTTAWGKQPPVSYQERLGWLDAADVLLFCELKQQIIRLYRQSAFDSYRDKLFTELPGAAQMARRDAWEKMLPSENCARY